MYRILLVDDEQLEREALSLFINKSDRLKGKIQLDECQSGSELVKKASAFNPDIIILDINMPGLNGLDALKKIREAGCDAVVIISSAYNLFDYAVSAMQLGVINFLVKPVKESVFIDALSQGIASLQKSEVEKSEDFTHEKTGSDIKNERSEEKIFDLKSLPENMQKVCRFIDENYQKQIQLDDIAEYCGYSRYHLSHLFRDSSGFTVFSYLLEVRMKKAKELLLSTDMSIKEISCEIGFSDQNYFSNVFKKQTGFSPMDFRNNF